MPDQLPALHRFHRSVRFDEILLVDDGGMLSIELTSFDRYSRVFHSRVFSEPATASSSIIYELQGGLISYIPYNHPGCSFYDASVLMTVSDTN